MNSVSGLKRVIQWMVNLSLIISSIISVQLVHAETVNLAVLYPQASGSYSKVFKNILAGIEEFEDIHIVTRAVTKNTRAEDVDNWLKENQIQTVLALGQLSYSISKNSKSGLPLTIGALVTSPNGHAGISMDGSPEVFFHHLLNLAPDVKRVHVVYSEKNTGWLIEIAELAAEKRNLELVSYKVENLKQGIKYYNHILISAESNTDAIWIPLDRVVPDKAILPKVLQAAWKNNIVTFSNNPIHAKKGTLFALFPDHRLMGKKLASIAVEQISSKGENKLFPTSDLKLAINKRTASHLGLSFSKSKLRQFDVVFPTR
ncbi:MAG: ABC transporter substrate binding protein [Pseudomonadota bacterium]